MTSVPARNLQDGTIVETEPTSKEMKLSKEVESLQHEPLLANEKYKLELVKELKLSKELFLKNKEIETLQHRLTLPMGRIYLKANASCSITIRDGHRVVLGLYDPSDKFQYWVKDDTFDAIVRSKFGYPTFALVNKHNGQALKPIVTTDGCLALVPYDPNVVDESILWTEDDDDLDDGYRVIRMATNLEICLDGSLLTRTFVGDGTSVFLWEYHGGDNQRCRMDSYY